MQVPQPPTLCPTGRAFPLLAFTSALLLLPQGGRAEFPEAGVDAFDTKMTLVLSIPPDDITVELEGPASATRSDPDGGDPCTIETRLLSLSLTGFDPELLDIEVTLNPELESRGEVVADGAGCNFPASSFFDVFLQIAVESLPFDLINLEPIRVAGTINALPPLFDTYDHPILETSLVKVETTGPEIGTIKTLSNHRPTQEPSFSVKTGGPSGLDPADLHDLDPLAIGLSRFGLGLIDLDDVDAVSYGLDIIDTPDEGEGGEMSIAFSVDKDALGLPNTGVNREALQAMGHEAEGDEFLSSFNGTNFELLDEEAVPLSPGDDDDDDGDDLDALTNEPTSYADTDGDLDADRPVFFSLAPGSPTLTALGESPATIFYSLGGVVDVFATEEDLGLEATDDLDALCLMKSGLPDSVTLIPGLGPPDVPAPGGASQFDYALFSLAKNSPTLATLGAAPGDLFVTDFSSARTPGQLPALFATADQIGLLDTDELNALKCLMQVAIIPIFGIPTEAGTLLINVGGNSTVAEPDDTYSVDPSLQRYGVWSMINPFIDFHGPYVHPNSTLAGSLLMPQVDPATVGFGANVDDICPLFHKHGTWEEHGDPDGPKCGHGMFVPHLGPAIGIEPGLVPFDLGTNMIVSFLSLRAQFPELYRAATLHRISLAFLQFLLGIGSAPSFTSEAGEVADENRVMAGPENDAYVIILTGIGRTKIDLTLDGADGLTVGPILASIPVPEPSGLLSGLTALVALAGLRKFGKRRSVA